ncbi:MAG: germination protein YpeB, partial [Clostridia bacterium]|nr:germination protein YpeB [Clostridia bacterium]
RMGGEVLTYLDPRPVQRVRLSRDEAERRALDFARKQGIPDPVITSSVLQGGRRIVALAPRQDGVVLYPAVVRLQVALDDGRILGYDAVGYWSARRHDRLPPATLSPAEAARRLPPGFQPSSSRLALIPLDTGREVLTYEFRGSAYGEDYLIYVNARTGEQENILRLVKTADGELAM